MFTFRHDSFLLVGMTAALGLCLASPVRAEEHEEHGEHGEGEKAAKPPASYAEGVKRIDHHLHEIAELIEGNKLADVHREAAVVRDTAKALPGLAAKKDSGVAQKALPEITKAAKALADTFSKIDEVADAGKMEETKKVHAQMNELFATLQKHAKEGTGHKMEEHHKD
ncbi:MAG: hypothetical protein HYU36_22150 [Planctomycetes bacterium]|nr:hypothetical protein [Planctomycetota bacterium]